MLIFITGYMASGKSKTGKHLAKLLGFSYLDLDQYIESRQQKPVSQIFAEQGEHHFRILEQHVLHLCCELKNTVVSCGGGTPCFFNNMEVIRFYGTSFYIETDNKILAERLEKRKHQRPLVAGKSKEELLQYVTESIEQRKNYYLQCDYRISNTGIKEKNAELIIEVLKAEELI